MKAHIRSGLMIMSFCASVTPGAGAQEAQDSQGTTDTPPLVSSNNRIDPVSFRLRGRSDFSNTGREWVADLERAGIVNRSLKGPYRVAVPLMTFGEKGPKVMITYARRLPGSAGDGGVLLFINIPTP